MRYFIYLTFLLMVSYGEAATVLITGGTRGIGLETAKTFQQAGWSVWAVSRSMPEKDDALKGINFRMMDVTDDNSVNKVVDEIIAKDGQIDALINNAGYGLIGAVESIKIEEARELFEVNFFGTMRVAQAVLPHMRKAGKGHILNVSSTSGIRALPLYGAYAASKFALEALTESLAIEASLWNIKVSSIEPGPTQTEWAKRSESGSRATNVLEYKKLEAKDKIDLIAALEKGQPVCEVATLIYKVATSENPDLRNPTSEMGKKVAAKRYVDPSGNQYRDEEVAFLKQQLKNVL